MFSGIVRNMFTLTSAGVVQQSMKTASGSLPLTIIRSFSMSPRVYESDPEFFVTESAGIPGYKIDRVRGQVLGKCSLLSVRDEDAISRASDICKHNARLEMIESAQRLKANAIVGVRYRGCAWMSDQGDTVERECRGDAVTLIKDKSYEEVSASELG